MKKNKFIVILSILLIIGISVVSFANSIEITKGKLKNSLEKIEKTGTGYKFNVNDDNIGVIVDGNEYIINYDLKNKPTFSYELIIDKGISYDEYNKKVSNLLLPFMGYVAVCDIQGVKIADSSTYYLGAMMAQGLNNINNSKYVIVDDSKYNTEVDSNLNKDKIVIRKSQFGEKVFEIIDSSYKEKNVIKDDYTGAINSFELISEKIKMSETSVKLKNTLKINLDADFTKLVGNSESLNESFLDKDITKENADFVVNLRVGQKCKFISNIEISGYMNTGSGMKVLNKDKNVYEMIAENEGKSNGYFYIGKVKKTYYINVEKNSANKVLKDVVIKLDEKEEIKKPEKIPQTGDKKYIFIILSSILSISIIRSLYKMNKSR